MEKENMIVEAIKHGKSRMATFKKRRNNLLKKAREFTILCGVELCVIIYGPKTRDGPSRPEIWASEEAQLFNIINRYKETSSSSSFHENSAEKGDDEEEEDDEIAVKTGRIVGGGSEKKFSTWDPRFDNFSEDQLGSIIGKVAMKLKDAEKKLKKMKSGDNVDLKNNKVKTQISRELSSFNNNGPQFGGACDSTMTVRNSSLHVGSSDCQMQIMPRLNNNHTNMDTCSSQVNISCDVSKSPPQKKKNERC
ncbi:hypothetical protein ACOSP7_026218 [Xanthoceras sorbifolium]